MGTKNLVITVLAEQGFLRNISEDTPASEQNEFFFNAISQTYLPLLRLTKKFAEQNLPVKIALVLAPQLCALFEDPVLQQKYIEFLDNRMALADKEISRNKKNKQIVELAKLYKEKAQQDKTDFTETYNQKLLSAFRKAQAAGRIELMSTSATYAYLPHYADLTESLNAQVETGLYSHRHFFGENAEGFYLPHLGYANGIDKILRSYGFNYTIVDAKSFLFSNDIPEYGIFAPVRTENSLVLFAADPDTNEEIYGEEGFASNEIYRCENRDIAFEIDAEDLPSFIGKEGKRVKTGFKYWTIESEDEYESQGTVYDAQQAMEQAKKDALEFYTKKAEKLSKAQALMGDKDSNLVLTIPAEVLGQSWYEGMTFFEEFLNLVLTKNEVQLSFCKELIKDQFSLPKFTPYPCSAAGVGYGENLLDDTNKWMFRYIRKATERMIDLTDRFPAETGLKGRLLNLGAKEVLLAQSSDWPRMLSQQQLPDYAEQMFTKNIISFTNVFDALASNSVSTEWLTKLEKEHSVFPWINYKIFSRKK